MLRPARLTLVLQLSNQAEEAEKVNQAERAEKTNSERGDSSTM